MALGAEPREKWPRLAPCLATALFAAASLLSAVDSQMNPPLQGQGVDPISAGYAVADPRRNVDASKRSVPVYVTAELVRLIEVDENDYTFSAIVVVYQVWEDPRAEAQFQLIRSASVQAKRAQAAALAACAQQPKDASNITADTQSANCTAAQTIDLPGATCHKFCTSYADGAMDRSMCCDMIWLPDFELRNLVSTPKERVMLDVIDSNGKDLVTRLTRIVGKFTAPLDFSLYPFDKQRLSMYINRNPYTSPYQKFYAVPSATFRRVNIIYQENQNRTGTVWGSTSDELAGWRISSFVFSCADISRELGQSTDSMVQTYDPNDPLYEQLGSFSPTDRLYSTCALTIDVSRMSNTAVVSSILPVAFCAFLSFLTFFMDPDKLDARAATCITLFLALTAVQFVFVGLLPTTASCNSLDIFILLSYCLIIMIVIESLVVYFIVTEHSGQEKEGECQIFDFRRRSKTIKLTREITVKGDEADGDVDDQANGHANGDDDDEPGPAVPLKKVKEQGFLAAFEEYFRDPFFAYRTARRIDLGSGATLFVLYVILAICNFTVGLS